MTAAIPPWPLRPPDAGHGRVLVVDDDEHIRKLLVRMLGAITPVGGFAFILGWLALAWAAWSARP